MSSVLPTHEYEIGTWTESTAGGSLTHLESHDGMVEIEGEEGLRQLAEERLQDDCCDVHVPILEHDLLTIVDFALEGNRRICTAFQVPSSIST